MQEAEPRGAATNAKAVQNRTQRETIINAPPAMTDDLAENIRGMAALSPFPPLSTSISYSPKAESISGNLKRSVLPQSPTRLAAQPKPKPRTTVGQPGLEVNGFAN